MSKAILLILAVFVAYIISELVVSKIVAYPPLGVDYKVRYRSGGETWSNIRKPHSPVYNVENKTHTKYNNYGLPGADIINFDNPVVLLGTSQVEALQHQPEQIASTVFENKIREFDPTFDVINLGCSGHDPYDSYFRLKYYERKLGIKTDKVLLLVNSDNSDWLKRHPQPLKFELGPDFGAVNNNPLMRWQIRLRNASSLAELFVKGILKEK